MVLVSAFGSSFTNDLQDPLLFGTSLGTSLETFTATEIINMNSFVEDFAAVTAIVEDRSITTTIKLFLANYFTSSDIANSN